ncbi:AraC family transcriptional regulator [Paenibacillus methanolicus]|uniref:AraC-like protein n=1 Tax=Paenibacillus methanolicus TaxID=582686 RepID=A0A5S5C6D5_9BACL|nr:AraC family transcriptional regulator [Paenibacillus methanolicus]TYP73956.1 AraC-like protein [Paenibacillus methanolicus]
MKRLFDPILFDGKRDTWFYRSYNDRDFNGFYHWHQCCELLFVHEGHGRVVLNRQSYEIRRGMLFFFQPYRLHHVHANVGEDAPYVRSVLYVDPAALAAALQALPRRSAFFGELVQGRDAQAVYDLSGIASLVEWMFERYEQGRRLQAGDAGQAEELTVLMLQLLQAMEDAAEKAPEGLSQAGQLEPLRTPRYSERVMQWIEQHYAEEFSLGRMAEELHLSKFYVSRLFRQETGSSITDYLTARRIKHACRLLRTTALPVERIGAEVGLPNPSYFIQLFKREVGRTPLKYRNG